MPDEASQTLCTRAESLIDVGRNAEALPLLAQAIAARPDDARPYCLQALALVNQEQFPPALRAAEAAVRLDPSGEWAHRLRAIILLALGKKRDALDSAREAVRLAPFETAALHTLARCELAVGRRREARAAAEHLRGLAPEWSQSHEILGLIALQERNARAAEAHYREALRLNPGSWVAMNNLGLALQRQGRRKEAIEQFHQAARVNPSKDLVRRNLSGAVRNYAGAGGLGAVYIAVQAARMLAGNRTNAGSHPIPPAVVFGILAVLIGICLGTYFLRARRMAELHPEVTHFYQDQSRRDRHRALVEVPLVLVAGLGGMFTVGWTLAWLIDGPEYAFGNGGVLPYEIVAALSLAAIGGCVWRFWWKKRRI